MTIGCIGVGITSWLMGAYPLMRFLQEAFLRKATQGFAKIKAICVKIAIWSLLGGIAINILFSIGINIYTSAIDYESCAIKPRRFPLTKEAVYTDSEFTCYAYNQQLKKEKPRDYE